MTEGYAVILAGGKGERFWPLSTTRRPKQLLSLVGDEPLLAQAVQRLEGIIPTERICVITNADLVEPCRAAAPRLPPDHVIGEPVGRDTAAAVALGAAWVKAKDPYAVFAVLTADHVIGDLDVFRASLRESISLAQSQDVLITIGIKPNEPSTGYGYIEAGDHVAEHPPVQFLRAKRFVEKPNQVTAEAYLASGRFYWNSGMFIWSMKAFESAIRRHQPALGDLIDTLLPVMDTETMPTVLEKVYGGLKKISIDYALMEKADNIVMVRGTFAWDDVGAWSALEHHFDRNDDGNIAIGACEAVGAENNIVFSENRLTALVGVRDLVVVQSEGVTLVCSKERAQDIKKLVECLRQRGTYDAVL